METGAVVVAAGMSSRMGDFKPMLSIGSISIAQRVVATLKQAGAARVVVVTGYNAEELERHLASSGVVFLRNENYRTTHMFDSALIGLRYLRDKCRQVLFTPVDIPLFTSATVEALLSSGAELACPVCGPAGRNSILQMIRDLHAAGGLTVIMVSHSMDDISTLATRLVVMSRGELVMTGTPREVFTQQEKLRSIGLGVPQAAELTHALIAEGFDLPGDLYTLDEVCHAILALKKEGRAC